MYYIYAHSKPNGSIFYIGKGKGSRAYVKGRRSSHWKSIVAKHGYEVTILANFDQESDAFQQEINCIHWLDDLCNLTLGGEGSSGYRATEETRKKISLWQTGRRLTKEHKLNMSLANIGKNSARYKGKIIAINIITEERLELFGAIDIRAHGFNSGAVYRCILGELRKHKGHTFTRESIEHIV